MKKILLAVLILQSSVLSVQASAVHDWENNHVLQINREPARAYFIPFSKSSGDMSLSLDGQWKFRWTKTPGEAVADFYVRGFDDSGWTSFPVPATWETSGYGTPIYVSSGYPFKIDPPRVTSEPPHDWTTYKERNPTGQYRRAFSVPGEWKKGHTILRFEGVQSAFYVWINGVKVGYSQGSYEPSEFNITPYIKAGNNEIAVEVYKYSDGSYLEDQDFWRLGGIQRDVLVYHAPDVRLRDFAVRTVAENGGYSEWSLQINPALQASDSETGEGYKVCAVLTDAGGRVVGTATEDAVPVLNLSHKAALMNEWFPQRGGRKFARMEIKMNSPLLWTAETPNLYTLTMQVKDSAGNIVQQARQKVGFREIKINGGMLLVNGKQVRLRGVNRHEHDPKAGHVMSESLMLKDLRLMKKANVNAVRTSHYPNHPRWYELCDSMGMYVMDEADCETHGLRGILTSDPDWNGAFMDRVIRMAERDKNHACVILWSLGNESGFGANHTSMAGFLHTFDPTRPVHYEGAQGVDNDPECVDVISRFYPRVKQTYLNPGVAPGSDVERPENARWEHLLDIAGRTNDSRPVLTSEYAHAMGNAMGNFKDYWDEIYSNPRMLGGFVWDWVDQAIWQVKDGKGAWLYGGAFGDKPSSGAFCLNGIVFADRTLNSKYQEVKYVYSPVQFVRHGSDIWVINRGSHLSLGNYKCCYRVFQNGDAGRHGVMDLKNVMPDDSAIVANANEYKFDSNKDARLNLTVLSAVGDTVVAQQIALNDNMIKAGSALSAAMVKERRIGIDEPVFTPQFYRAPTDNDRGFGNWLAKEWKNCKLDSPVVVKVAADVTEYRYPEGKIIVKRHTERETVKGVEYVAYTFDFSFSGTLPELPRLGVTLALPRSYEHVEWYGRGPWDSYPDRRQAALIGLWKGEVSGQYTHYPRPQDNGNHEDCSVVRLAYGRGKCICIEAVDSSFSFSALHYTPQDIASAKYDYQLREGNYTMLNIDCRVMGLGNSSCGPGVLKKYSIDKNRHYQLKFRLHR